MGTSTGRDVDLEARKEHVPRRNPEAAGIFSPETLRGLVIGLRAKIKANPALWSNGDILNAIVKLLKWGDPRVKQDAADYSADDQLLKNTLKERGM